MSRANRQLRRRRERQARKGRRAGRAKTDAVQTAIGELHIRLAALDPDEWPQRDTMLTCLRELGGLYFSAKFVAQMDKRNEGCGEGCVGCKEECENVPSIMKEEV